MFLWFLQAMDLKTQEELTTNSARIAVQKLREQEQKQQQRHSDKNGNNNTQTKKEDTKSSLSSVTVTTTTSVSESPALLSLVENVGTSPAFTALRHTLAGTERPSTRLSTGTSGEGGSQPVFPSPTLMGNEGEGPYSGAITRSKTNSCVAKPINLVPTSTSPMGKALPRVSHNVHFLFLSCSSPFVKHLF